MLRGTSGPIAATQRNRSSSTSDAERVDRVGHHLRPRVQTHVEGGHDREEAGARFRGPPTAARCGARNRPAAARRRRSPRRSPRRSCRPVRGRARSSQSRPAAGSRPPQRRCNVRRERTARGRRGSSSSSVPWQPGPTTALAVRGSTSAESRPARSISSTPSRRWFAAQLCPPEQTVARRPSRRASCTAAETSAASRGRTITSGWRAGFRSFQRLPRRASSYPCSPLCSASKPRTPYLAVAAGPRMGS